MFLALAAASASMNVHVQWRPLGGEELLKGILREDPKTGGAEFLATFGIRTDLEWPYREGHQVPEVLDPNSGIALPQPKENDDGYDEATREYLQSQKRAKQGHARTCEPIFDDDLAWNSKSLEEDLAPPVLDSGLTLGAYFGKCSIRVQSTSPAHSNARSLHGLRTCLHTMSHTCPRICMCTCIHMPVHSHCTLH